MKVLHMTLKKKWFDMINSGEKTEEYREIKPYWIVRLVDKDIFKGYTSERFIKWFENGGDYVTLDHVKNEFKWVRFKNGYSPNSRVMIREVFGLQISIGKPEWGAEPGKKYFVIKLGERIL